MSRLRCSATLSSASFCNTAVNDTSAQCLLLSLTLKNSEMVLLILTTAKPLGPLPHTHTRLTALYPGLPGWAGTRKVKPIWILLKQETVSGSDISWAICKSALRSRQIATPAPHHSVFYRPDALRATPKTLESSIWLTTSHVAPDGWVWSCATQYWPGYRLSVGTELTCIKRSHRNCNVAIKQEIQRRQWWWNIVSWSVSFSASV